MKIGYKIALSSLGVVSLFYLYFVLTTPFGARPGLETAIYGTGVLVALAAIVVAMAATDPKTRKIAMSIELSVGKEDGVYHKRDIDIFHKRDFEQYPDPIISRRIIFTLVNISGYDLPHPTFTFRLPSDRQHPRQEEDKIRSRTFHSNLFSSPDPPYQIEFGDTCILSNRILPFFNDRDSISIWVRMVLHPKNIPFHVTAYVNCDDAKGWSQEITIHLPKLFETVTEDEENYPPVE